MNKASKLLPLALAALTLLALACAPAEPTAAPEATAAPEVVAPPTAVVPAGATAVPVAGVESPKVGRYVERAGLRIFVPEGFEFGGPIIPADPRPPRYGGTLIRATNSDPPSIDPYHTPTSQMVFHVAQVYERLVHIPVGPDIDTTLDVRIGGLAESWEVSDDLLKYTFHLRKGIKWHNLPPVNGREFDAEDVKFTLDLFKSPGSSQAGFFEDVDRVEVVDKDTAVYHMKRVSPGILSVLTDTGRGFILPRESGDSATFNRRLRAIGTGPFMVETDYQFKVGLTERRNPDYWVKDKDGNRLPYLDAVRTAIISDASATLAAFRTGKIDQGAVFPNATAMRALIRTNPTTLVQERTASPYGSIGVGFRLDKAPWNDVRVRRALSLAIDYETMAQTVAQVPFFGFIWISGAWYGQPSNTLEAITKDCGCPWYSYDPTRAKALLAEAGFPNGLTTTFEYQPYGSVARTEQYELMGAWWKEIGVNVSIRQVDTPIFRPNLIAGAWPDLGMIFQFPAPSSKYNALDTLVPGSVANALAGWVNDEKLTALVKDAKASFRDDARLNDLLRQVRAYWLDQVFNIPEASGPGYGAFSPRLRNYQSSNSYLISLDLRVYIPVWIDDDWSFSK